MTNKKIKINNIEQIETDQLIWEIENSNDFYIYELYDSNEQVNVLVKIINNKNNFN